MVKKIINNSDEIVTEMIEGFVEAFPQWYEKHPSVNGIISKQRKQDRVALVIGGGTGHEPMFAGFVGNGLADAAVCGNVFTAPDPETIHHLAKSVDQGKGVLFVYGSYPGDKMNFDIGEELLRKSGVNTKHVCVYDDVISAPSDKIEERRGIAGDVYVIKVAGAACSAGLSLEEAARVTMKANNNVRSIGIATGLLHPYNQPFQTIERTENNIEYGVGLHGERGVLSTPMQPADRLVDMMYEQIMNEDVVHAGDEVCVLVNSLGATSITELAIVFRRIKQLLDNEGIHIYDVDMNNYCTSQQMEGFSITLFKLDDELKKYYDMPCYSPYYSRNCMQPDDGIPLKIDSIENGRTIKAETKKQKKPYTPAVRNGRIETLDILTARDMMIHVANRLISAKEYLSELDSVIGDGDHGICMASGMQKVKLRLMEMTESEPVYQVFEMTGKTMLISTGGASGVLFGNMFLAMAEDLKGKEEISAKDLATMERKALAKVQEKGRAHKGDKTMVDALYPAVKALEKNAQKGLAEALKKAEDAAEQGMLNTKNMVAKFGRGKFLVNRALGCQDAGATTIWLMFQAMREYVEETK